MRAAARSAVSPARSLVVPGEPGELTAAWMWLRASTVGGRRVTAMDGKTLRGRAGRCRLSAPAAAKPTK